MTDLQIMLDSLDELVQLPDASQVIKQEILRLAISGQLVPQIADEGNARELLSRIQVDKAELLRKHGHRASTPTRGKRVVATRRFEIPESWAWVEAATVCTVVVDGDHQPPPRSHSGIPFAVIGDVSGGKLVVERISRNVPTQYYDNLDWAHRPQVGDVLYTTVGSFGIPVLVDDDAPFCFQRHIAMFRPVLLEMQRYLYRVLQSGLAYSHAAAAATGIAQKTVPLSGLRSMPIPIPPLGEQRRIVAKVDELFALVDSVQKAISEEATAHDLLAEDAIQELAASADPAILSLIGETLTSVASTFSLQDAIRQLAVTGRLSSSLAEDQSVEAIIDRAADQSLDAPDLDDTGFEPLPKGWRWVPLGACLTEIQAGWSPSSQGRPKQGDEWGVLKVSACSWGEFRPDENKALLPSQEPRTELEVQTGDLLISRANTAQLVARSVVVKEAPPNLMLSDKTLRLTPLEGCVPEYLNLANLSRVARRHYVGEASGTSSSMLNVSQKVIRKTPIPLPPTAEQVRIVNVFERLSRQIILIRQILTDSN